MHAFVGGGNVIARICGPSCSVRPRRARGLPVCFTFTPSSCDVVRALLTHPVLLGKFPASRWSPAFFLCKVRMTTRPARSGFTISDPSTPLSFRQPNEPIDFSGEVAWPIAAAAAYHLECATPSLERGGEGGAGRSALRQRPWPRSPHTLGRTRGRTNGRTDRRARRRCRSRAAPAGLTHASKACLPPAALRRRPSLALPLPLSVRKNLLHRSQDRKRARARERVGGGGGALLRPKCSLHIRGRERAPSSSPNSYLFPECPRVTDR